MKALRKALVVGTALSFTIVAVAAIIEISTDTDLSKIIGSFMILPPLLMFLGVLTVLYE